MCMCIYIYIQTVWCTWHTWHILKIHLYTNISQRYPTKYLRNFTACTYKIKQIGCSLKWGILEWLVYAGKTHWNRWLGGPPILGHLNIKKEKQHNIIFMNQISRIDLPSSLPGARWWSPSPVCNCGSRQGCREPPAAGGQQAVWEQPGWVCGGC